MKLYCKIERGEKTIKEYLLEFFKAPYLATPHLIMGHETYFDEALQAQQCHRAHRSFEDLYSLITTYYEDTTKEDLAKILFELNKEGRLKSGFCGHIYKWVFRGVMIDDYVASFNEISYKYYKDEKGKGEYTLLDIYRLAGEEFTEEQVIYKNGGLAANG